MPVIAFTQEMGSLAKDVAVKLAEEMKLDIARHEVIDNVSSRMHVPKSLVSRLREGKAGKIERMRADRDAMAIFTAVAGARPACCGPSVMSSRCASPGHSTSASRG
jgi:hypothetical protein